MLCKIKNRPFTELTFQLQLYALQFKNTFGNGQAKSRTAITARSRRIGLCKPVENNLLLFLFNANAGICYAYGKGNRSTRNFINFYGQQYRPLFCKFNGI